MSTPSTSGYSSSIDTGLQPIPDLTNISSPDKLAFQFIQLYNAVGILAQAIDDYTGNTPQSNSNPNAPPESTVLVGNTANMWCVANAAINAGFLVTLINSSGVTKAELASAGSKTTPAMGMSMNSVAAGAQLQVLLLGLFNFGGSVTPGQMYYLSNSVPGGLSTSTTGYVTGNIVQAVGFGVDTESIFFNPTLTFQQL